MDSSENKREGKGRNDSDFSTVGDDAAVYIIVCVRVSLPGGWLAMEARWEISVEMETIATQAQSYCGQISKIT